MPYERNESATALPVPACPELTSTQLTNEAHHGTSSVVKRPVVAWYSSTRGLWRLPTISRTPISPRALAIHAGSPLALLPAPGPDGPPCGSCAGVLPGA